MGYRKVLCIRDLVDLDVNGSADGLQGGPVPDRTRSLPPNMPGRGSEYAWAVAGPSAKGDRYALRLIVPRRHLSLDVFADVLSRYYEPCAGRWPGRQQVEIPGLRQSLPDKAPESASRTGGC